MRTTTTQALVVTLVGLCCGGCMTSVRFADRQILWRDPDQDPIPMPSENELGDNQIRLRAALFQPLDHALRIDVAEARNVNALDEVPDSSWYEDPRRAAANAGKPFGPAEVAAAPLPGPEPPFIVVQGKASGASRGVVVTDKNGVKFIIKLDAPGYKSLSTSTEVVAARIVRASGWRTTSVTLIDVTPDLFTVSPKATYRDQLERKHRFTAEMLGKLFNDVPQIENGKYRASAGRWLEGKPAGPFNYNGVRLDDPNDRVPHQDRRDMRGYGVVAQWINNVDTLDHNNFDAYVGKPGQGHLLHYQQDVGGSFGNYAIGPLTPWMGNQAWFEGDKMIANIFTLGATSTQPWDRPKWLLEYKQITEKWPELGWFDADHFEPRRWRPLWPNPAFVRATARDLYWGAKRVLAFSAEEIRAAIAVGQYRPETAQRLFDILWARRDKIARAYLADVAPLEQFRFTSDGAMCFDDLWEQAGLGDGRPAEYRVRTRAVTAAPVTFAAGAERCTKLSNGKGYQIIEIRIRRADKKLGPPVRVHLVQDQGQRRIIGIER